MRLFFLRDKQKFPVACVVAELSAPGMVYTVSYGITVYNPKDRFNKAEARFHAMENFLTKPTRVPVNPWTGAMETVINHIRSNPAVSHTGQRAAAEWFRTHRSHSNNGR